MENVVFIPEGFESVEFGYGERAENLCSPFYGEDIAVNTLFINAPEKIILKNPDSVKCVLPVCIRYSISLRRSLKYADSSHNILSIRRLPDGESYSGWVYANDSEGEHNFPDDYDKEMWAQSRKEIAEAQNYSDEELGEGSYSEGYMNVDVPEYVDFPITSGSYEIFFSMSGLESNRSIVEIAIK
jgi:hypothetical protein